MVSTLNNHHIESGHLRVDGSNHTRLAVLRLRTVEPDRLLVHDTDRVSENVLSTGGSVHWHEAREKGGSHIGHDVLNWYTRLIERRLDYRVVLYMELAL